MSAVPEVEVDVEAITKDLEREGLSRRQRWTEDYRQAKTGVKGSLLWQLLRRQKRAVWTLLFFFLLGTIFNLVIANLTRVLVDDGLVNQTVELGPIVGRIVVLAFFAALCAFVSNQLTQRVGYHIEYELRTWLYARIQSAELLHLDAVASGQLVTRALTDLQIFEHFMRLVPIIVGLVPIMLALALMLFVFSPPMAIIACLAVPVNLYLLRRFRTRLWGLSWAELNERAEVMAAIDEPVRGIRVVKAFGREEHEQRRVAAVAERTFRFAISRVRLIARFDAPMKLIPYIGQAFVLLVGAMLLSNGSLTLGTFLIAFQVSSGLGRITQIFDELASAWQYLRSAQLRLGEMLALGSRATAAGRPLPESSSGLEVTGLGVDLGGRPVLDGIDLAVAPGELTVVIGGPGSGKSTLAGVVAGILAADRGEVVLDGVHVGDVDGDALRKAVRVVSEESMLFATTLRENLRMGASVEVEDDELAQALWAAAADDVVASLEGGLDGDVGDRGLTLSGGQRQRLALARALVARPRLLVLDEALASVNPSLEIEILRRIRSYSPETAILCITRRVGPARLADRTIELPLPSGAPAQNGDMGIVEPEALRLDSTLATVVGALQLSDERPIANDELVDDERPGELRWLTKPFRGIIGLALVVLLVQTLSLLAPEALFGGIAEVVEDDPGQAYMRAVLLMGVGFIYAGAAYLFRILAQRFNQNFIYILRRRMFRRLSRLGVDYYDRELPGQVAARVVHDLDTLLLFIERTGFIMLTRLFQLLVGFALISIIGPSVLPVVLLMSVLIIVATLIQLPIGMQAQNWSRDELGTVTAKFQEDFNARQEIRNLGAGELQFEKFVAASWERRRARWWVALTGSAYLGVMNFLMNLTGALVLLRAGDLVLGGTLAIGMALTMRVLTQTATEPLRELPNYYNQLLEVRVSWDRLKQPFEVPILPEVKPNAQQCPPLAGEVQFDHVQFRYPHTGRVVLHDVSFTIPPGTVAALVGYTGAGKSSIAKLLLRTYDPTAGVVRVDGVDLRDLEFDSFRSRMGVVPQDAFVFKGTVASNIAYGRPDASIDEIQTAAEAVGADELLESLAGGYQHPVEEEGRNLTAAQRQLIALARVWLAGPDVLVLDEATSCLDAASEQRVLDALGRLGCTTLMITHRENVAEASDLIIVLDDGRVVEEGTTREIVNAGGPYNGLWATEEQLVAAGAKAAGNGRRRVTARRAPAKSVARGREELYELAKKKNIKGRSKMSTAELISALGLEPSRKRKR